MNFETQRTLIFPNPKRLEYEKNKDITYDNPFISGLLGRIIIPLGIAGSLYFAGAYLYHRFIPSYQLIDPTLCYEILYKIRSVWGQTITQSSRQEQKLLDDYQHLPSEQQAHLIDILRQTLLSDLALSEQYIFQHYSVSKSQMKATIEHYTKTLPVQQQDQQLAKISTELIKLVRLVLPTPELPLGWEVSDALGLISQWFELRLQIMERTYFQLGFDKIVFNHGQSTSNAGQSGDQFGPEIDNEDEHIRLNDDHSTSTSTSSAKRIQPSKLTPEQLQLLNSTYTENVTMQVETFCVEKGISSTFISYLNKCLVNEPQFHAIISQYRELQKKQFTPLGIDLK